MQGRCESCRVRWTWEGAPSLRNATCPKCGHRLLRTSHQYSGVTRAARGDGRPRRLVAVTFYELLATAPHAAARDVNRRWSEHLATHPARASGFPAVEPGCPTCTALRHEKDQADRAIAKREQPDAAYQSEGRLRSMEGYGDYQGPRSWP